jgi:hypothetical protein
MIEIDSTVPLQTTRAVLLAVARTRVRGHAVVRKENWPASDIMSRRRRRNDILPLMIAQHPLLTTDKSAFSPLDKIALQSTPGWRAIWMESCVHDVPPTRSTAQK